MWPNLPLEQQLDRAGTESRGQDAVEAGRRAAALQVTEHDAPRFLAGQRLELGGDECADAAQPFGDRRRPFRTTTAAAHRLRALGDHDDAEAGAIGVPCLDAFGDLRQIERNLRNQDDVGAAGDAGIEGNPARVAAHDLDDHDAVVRFGGRVQPVDGVGREADRGVEAERVRRFDDVVVDGLGDADERDAALRELVGDASVPSPPMTTSASSRSSWNISTQRSE